MLEDCFSEFEGDHFRALDPGEFETIFGGHVNAIERWTRDDGAVLGIVTADPGKPTFGFAALARINGGYRWADGGTGFETKFAARDMLIDQMIEVAEDGFEPAQRH
jgi:hypothetical protein